MKIRTVKYFVKEGAFNLYRNKLMTLASVGIVAVALIIFGIFYLGTVYLNQMTYTFKNQLSMEAYCNPEADDVQVKQVEEAIKKNDKIKEYKTVTKKEAFEKLKKMLQSNKEMSGGNEKILEGYDESFMPVSFVIQLKDPKDSTTVMDQLKKINGVENVRYSQWMMDAYTKIISWVRFICMFLIGIFIIVAVFLIANTIKLTVFARRREISIMKFVGATDWFIRWPFVVEGAIIGFAGAIFAFIALSLINNIMEGEFGQNISSVSSNLIHFIKLNEIGLSIILYYMTIGIVVGSIGSIISIRKYLKV